MKRPASERQGDLPLPAALAILAVVCFLIFAGADTPRFFGELGALAAAFEDNLVYFTTSLVAGSLSFAWAASQYRRKVKLTKQGSRLEALLGNADN